MNANIRAKLESMNPADGKEIALGVLAVGQYFTKLSIEQIKPVMDAAKAYLLEHHSRNDKNWTAIIDGEEVATVTPSKPGEKWAITDPIAWGRWLETSGRDRDPWEMGVKKRVLSPAYLRVVMESVEDTGEVPDGVELVEKTPSVSVRISDKQRKNLRRLQEVAGIESAVHLITSQVEGVQG